MSVARLEILRREPVLNGTAFGAAGRPSIAERYGDRAGYLDRVRGEADGMVAARFLLAEDVDAVVARASVLWDFVVNRTPSGE
jgi:hypothetical protein